MGFLEDTIVKAKEVIDVAGKKTSEVITVQKLKVNAASLKHQIAKDYETLGRLWFDSQKANNSNGKSLEVLYKEIERKQQELKKLEMEIALTKNGKICGCCGHVNESDAHYCNKCGKELCFAKEATEETEEADEEV